MTKLLGVACACVSAALWSCAPAGAVRAPTPAECRLDQDHENPLHDAGRILDMQVLTKKNRRGNPLGGDTKQGIAIVVRPERGLTLEWLSHIVECDVATPHPTDSTCPLSLPSARAAVDSSQGHLVVYVRYTDPRSVQRAVDLANQFRASHAG